ncbi:radical SAM protein [Oribacterium sp. NK2B42]|uniref:radical SAM protein n=1 Tax=Oribacterium sp. NK2B42 TaxID=689781 RepID=UPI0004087E3E|nr:radical SAM protein [Oribacterium sp. NK2B42]
MNKTFSLNTIVDYTKQYHLPLSVHWDLTEFCNLKCKHCFINKKPKYVDLPLALEVVDFLKDKGFFLVTLSGGEALLHPHFPIIYKALKQAGMLITLFTNGTNFTSEIQELLSQYKPYKVEVSVYGIDEQSCFEFTGIKGSYNKLIEGLEFLSDNSINTTLKVPLTIKSQKYIDTIIQMSQKYGFKYRFGTLILPVLENNDHSVLSERLSAEQIANIIFSFPESYSYYEEYYNSRNDNVSFESRCSSMMNHYTICIDAFQFCLNTKNPSYKFFDRKSLYEGFTNITSYRKNMLEAYRESACGNCKLNKYCLGCPAYLRLENGNTNHCNEYLKCLTKEKMKKIHE